MLKVESLNEWDDEERDSVAGSLESVKGDKAAELRRREAEAIYGSAEDVAGPVDEDYVNGWDFDRPETYTITKLTAGVKDPNRVNVFLDGNFAFSLDVNQVVDLGVKVQQKVDAKRLKELREASEFGKLYQRTLEWVLTRPHSVRETQDYLKRRQIKRRQLNRQRAREEKKALPEFDDHLTKLVLDRLIEKKYIDDQKFAEFYVENRYVRKGISHKRLRMEMMRKGVDSEIIAKTFEKVPRDEDEEIMKMIAKKRAKYKTDFQLVGYLVRQGFNFQNAKTAVEKYAEEHAEA